MRVEVLDAALAEAAEAAAWYEREVPALGEDFLDELDRALAGISERPHAWPRLGTVRRRAVRRFVLRRFPFNVVYIRRSDHVLVVAVAHHRRRPRYWAGRLGR